jgi:predicted metal-dependent hydrolase
MEKITAAGLTRLQIKEIKQFIADNSTHSRAETAINKALTRHKTEERADQTKPKQTGRDLDFWNHENKLVINSLSKVVSSYDKHSTEVTLKLINDFS